MSFKLVREVSDKEITECCFKEKSRNDISSFQVPFKKNIFLLNPLGTNTRKWSKTFKRIRRQFTDELLEFVFTILWGWH